MKFETKEAGKAFITNVILGSILFVPLAFLLRKYDLNLWLLHTVCVTFLSVIWSVMLSISLLLIEIRRSAINQVFEEEEKEREEERIKFRKTFNDMLQDNKAPK